MSTFLVRLSERLPRDIDPELSADLRERTRDRLSGWQRVWRVSGSVTLVALVDAPDLDILHGQIAQLPLLPWLDRKSVV